MDFVSPNSILLDLERSDGKVSLGPVRLPFMAIRRLRFTLTSELSEGTQNYHRFMDSLSLRALELRIFSTEDYSLDAGVYNSSDGEAIFFAWGRVFEAYASNFEKLERLEDFALGAFAAMDFG